MGYLLKKVDWQITSRCNLNCINCGILCEKEENIEELSTDDCFNIIEDLSELGCKFITLSGGEPLLRNDLYLIIASIIQHGIYPILVTNGTLINNDTVQKLKVIKQISLSISLDSLKKNLYEQMKDKANIFDKINNAINLLKKNKINFSIYTTINKLNINELSSIRDFIIKNKIKNWQISYEKKTENNQNGLTENEFYKIAKFIIDTNRNYSKEINCTGNPAQFGYMNKESRYIQGNWKGCIAGINVIGITSSGNIKGCLYLKDKKYIENNIKKCSIKNIWNNKESFQYNRRFSMKDLTGFCIKCNYASICRGGCKGFCNNKNSNNIFCLNQIRKEIN